MANNVISNAANRPLFARSGTVPDVSDAMQDYFQPMMFEKLTKTVVAGEAVETGVPINFRGVIYPFTDRQLYLKEEGQRAWTWFELFADPVLTLDVDDVVNYKGIQTRVMARRDYAIYGYVQYQLVQDFTGSGP